MHAFAGRTPLCQSFQPNDAPRERAALRRELAVSTVHFAMMARICLSRYTSAQRQDQSHLPADPRSTAPDYPFPSSFCVQAECCVRPESLQLMNPSVFTVQDLVREALATSPQARSEYSHLTLLLENRLGETARPKEHSVYPREILVTAPNCEQSGPSE